MNADRLLAHYEEIADAADAVARLRRFILDLAVRGKLMPQDSSDEPASELLKRVAKEKLDQAGLPQGWRRAKIGSILEFRYGKGLKAAERSEEGPVPVFGSNGIVGFTEEPLTVRPSIIIGRKGSAGALNLCDGPSWTTDVAYFVEVPSFLDLRFMLNALAALDLDKLGKGVKPGLSRSEAYDQIIAVPPLAEQHRIVAKVDELMGLCDRLETARASREAVRDRLVAATLARVNAPDPETFQADARFTLNALTVLTARPDQIKGLRQTVLNLAVRGKLVPQDPNDEPASELFKRFTKERQRRGKSGRAGSLQQVATATSLPEGWTAATLSELAIFENGDRSSNYPSGTDILGSGVAFFSTKNLSDHQLRFTNLDYISEAKFSSLRSGKLKDRDILVTLRGSVGKFGLFRASEDVKTGFINAQLLIVRSFLPEFVEFLLTFMKSEAFSTQLETRASGSATPQLSAGQLAQVVIPLPPLAEQHRIVAKIDTLMALCDRLEAGLTATAATRRRLLDALLAEALTPAEDRELEAAE
jgi:type I restriction enzyme, S subunit